MSWMRGVGVKARTLSVRWRIEQPKTSAQLRPATYRCPRQANLGVARLSDWRTGAVGIDEFPARCLGVNRGSSANLRGVEDEGHVFATAERAHWRGLRC